MAATIINTGNGSTATAVTSDTFSLGFTAAAGDSLIVAVACNTKTRSVTSVTDSASNSGWVLLAGAGSSSAGNVYLFWNPNLAASITSITTSYSGTSKVSVGWMEVSGLSGVVDGTPVATNITTSATTQSQSVTTTANDFIVVAISVPGSPSASSVDSPFTLEMGTHGSGSGTSETIADASEASAGTYTATFHLSAAAAVTIASAALEVAATGVSGTATDTNTTFAGSATGFQAGSATDSHTTFGGAASGTVTKTGTATDSQTMFRGSAVGSAPVNGTATDTHTAFGGSASGTVTKAGSATDASTAFRGAASGSSGFFGSATDSQTAFRGSATGSVVTAGAGSGATSFAGHATGNGGGIPGWLFEVGWDQGAGLFTIGSSRLGASSSPPSATMIASGQQTSSGSSIAATISHAAAAGELIVAVFSWASQAAQTKTCLDSKGNTYAIYPNLSENPSHAICISTLATALAIGDTITLALQTKSGGVASVGGRMYSAASYGSGMEANVVDQASITGAASSTDVTGAATFHISTGQLDQAVEKAVLVFSADTGGGGGFLSGTSVTGPFGWASRDSIASTGLPQKIVDWWDLSVSNSTPLSAAVSVAGMVDGVNWGGSLLTLRVAARTITGDTLAGPYSEPTWSVVDEVQVAAINRGRQDAVADVQAGELDVTIVDTDQTYNPKNSLSPLAGRLKPRRFARLSYGYTNPDTTVTTIYLFRGYIREITAPQSRQSPYATITCIDVLEEMSVLKPVISSTGPTTTGGAVNAILNAIEYPSTLRSLSVGDSIPDFSSDGTTDALTLIESLLAAELGEFFIAADGTATYIDHAGRQTRAATISTTNLLAPGVSLETIVTQATVIRADQDGNQLGQPQTYQDGAAVNDYNIRVPQSDPLSTPYVSSDQQALDLATRMVTLWKDPRSPIWTLQLNYNPSDSATYLQMLSRDLGDRVAVNDPATGGGGDYTIEGIQHQVDTAGLNHVTTWALLERATGSFIIGSSLIESLDTLAV